MLIDIDRLRSPLGHEYLPSAGHEDDDHCSSVLNNGEQCGQARGAHYAPDVVMEYLDVMERRLEDPAQAVRNETDIATWFGLSYSNFLVLHRVLLEGMPRWWQVDFVARLGQLHASYSHLRHPEGYEVHPCRYVEVRELSVAERKSAGVTSSLDGFPPPPQNPTEEEVTAYEAAYEAAYDAEVFYDANGNELGRWQRVPLRVPDPIPHYRHGRVVPRLPGFLPGLQAGASSGRVR